MLFLSSAALIGGWIAARYSEFARQVEPNIKAVADWKGAVFALSGAILMVVQAVSSLR